MRSIGASPAAGLTSENGLSTTGPPPPLLSRVDALEDAALLRPLIDDACVIVPVLPGREREGRAVTLAARAAAAEAAGVGARVLVGVTGPAGWGGTLSPPVDNDDSLLAAEGRAMAADATGPLSPGTSGSPAAPGSRPGSATGSAAATSPRGRGARSPSPVPPPIPEDGEPNSLSTSRGGAPTPLNNAPPPHPHPALTAADEPRRCPLPSAADLVRVERLLLRAHCPHLRLRTHVVAAGLVYGGGECDAGIHPLWRDAYSNPDTPPAVAGGGAGVLPLVRLEALVDYVRRVAGDPAGETTPDVTGTGARRMSHASAAPSAPPDGRGAAFPLTAGVAHAPPPGRYLLCADPPRVRPDGTEAWGEPLRDVARAVAGALANSNPASIALRRASAAEVLADPGATLLSLHCPFACTKLPDGEGCRAVWASGVGEEEASGEDGDALADASAAPSSAADPYPPFSRGGALAALPVFLRRRGLVPAPRIALSGPPASGKTRLAVALAALYRVPVATPRGAVTWWASLSPEDRAARLALCPPDPALAGGGVPGSVVGKARGGSAKPAAKGGKGGVSAAAVDANAAPARLGHHEMGVALRHYLSLPAHRGGWVLDGAPRALEGAAALLLSGRYLRAAEARVVAEAARGGKGSGKGGGKGGAAATEPEEELPPLPPRVVDPAVAPTAWVSLELDETTRGRRLRLLSEAAEAWAALRDGGSVGAHGSDAAAAANATVEGPAAALETLAAVLASADPLAPTKGLLRLARAAAAASAPTPPTPDSPPPPAFFHPHDDVEGAARRAGEWDAERARDAADVEGRVVEWERRRAELEKELLPEVKAEEREREVQRKERRKQPGWTEEDEAAADAADDEAAAVRAADRAARVDAMAGPRPRLGGWLRLLSDLLGEAVPAADAAAAAAEGGLQGGGAVSADLPEPSPDAGRLIVLSTSLPELPSVARDAARAAAALAEAEATREAAEREREAKEAAAQAVEAAKGAAAAAKKASGKKEKRPKKGATATDEPPALPDLGVRRSGEPPPEPLPLPPSAMLEEDASTVLPALLARVARFVGNPRNYGGWPRRWDVHRPAAFLSSPAAWGLGPGVEGGDAAAAASDGAADARQAALSALSAAHARREMENTAAWENREAERAARLATRVMGGAVAWRRAARVADLERRAKGEAAALRAPLLECRGQRLTQNLLDDVMPAAATALLEAYARGRASGALAQRGAMRRDSMMYRRKSMSVAAGAGTGAGGAEIDDDDDESDDPEADAAAARSAARTALLDAAKAGDEAAAAAAESARRAATAESAQRLGEALAKAAGGRVSEAIDAYSNPLFHEGLQRAG